jgi:hypothetical protein
MNPVEQAFPPPEGVPKWSDLFGIDPEYGDTDPPPEREQLRALVHENERLRADLILANQRIVALEARLQRINRESDARLMGVRYEPPSDT